MRDVSIVGIGRTPVAEHWDMGLRQIALGAIGAALDDADLGHADIDALIVATSTASGGELAIRNEIE